MDCNYYAVGHGGDVVRYRGVSYTLDEWKGFAGSMASENSQYHADLGAVKLVITDSQDSLNPDLGKIQPDSPVIDKGCALYPLAVDRWGDSRPYGKALDIGADEYHPGRIERPRNLRIEEML